MHRGGTLQVLSAGLGRWGQLRCRGGAAYARLLSLRSRSTDSATVSMANSTSSGVLNRPRPKRRLAAGLILVQAQGPQYMAGLGVGRRASTAGADGQMLHAHHQGLAVDVGKAGVEVVGQTVVVGQLRTVQRHAFEPL